MSAEVAIRARLLATAGVTTIASTRIWQLKLPQSPVFPAVRLQLVSEPLGYHLRGPDGAIRARVQVDAVTQEVSGGATYTQADSLADAIDAALSGQVFTISGIRVTGCLRDNRRPLYNPQELREIAIAQDYIVWWKTA